MAKAAKRSSVIVKHVSNEDVEHHINVLGVKNQRKTRSSCGIAAEFFNDIPGIKKKASEAGKPQKSPKGKSESNNNDTEGTDRDILDEISILGPSTLTDTNAQYGGGDIFSFKTPKRSKQMSKVAAESSRKVRNNEKISSKENADPGALKTGNKLFKTPGKKPEESVNEAKTPGKRTASKTPGKTDLKTPSGMSKRSKKYLVQEMQARQQDGSDSSEGSASEIDEDEEGADGEPASGRAQAEAKRIALPSETELYFEAHKAGQKLRATTSDRTLARLKLPQLNQDRMQTILDEIEKRKLAIAKRGKGHDHSAKIELSRQRLIAQHRKNFQKWMFYICNGYNVVLYGLGSKRKLVHEFCDKMLGDYDKVVVNGYFPSLIVKSILTSICEVINDVTVVNSNQQQAQLDAICKKYANPDIDDEHLFLIVHNIDGATLRNMKAQNVLSQLADCKGIHIIATVDHINASLIWDQAKLSRFNWLWYDCTTFEAYKDETSFENSLLLLTSGSGIGGSLALSGLVHVARSLTPNARGIFKLIAEYQIEESKSNPVNYIGLSFSDLYQMCREKFLVNSELTLRTQLTEFLDHKLVQIRKGTDGGECLSIPLDNPTLQEYLDQAQ